MDRTIKDFANEYEPKRMKNIADLEVVRTDLKVQEETREDQSGEKYHVIFTVINEEEYRIAPSIMEQLKTVLTAKPELKTFQVKKTGEGKGTKYQVISLD